MKRRRIPYSTAELRFIESRRSMSREKLHAAFVQEFARSDIDVDHIKSLCSRNGWTSGRKRWTPAEDEQLRIRYADTKTDIIAADLGRSLSTTYQRARKLGLEKSEAYLESPSACRLRRGDNVGAACRFQKGHAPANKGLRRPGWSPGRMKETQFKKGVRQGVATRLYKPIGSERLSKEGYLERKIHDGMPLQSRWRAVHRIRWEEINGPQPKGMALKCLDGDRANTDPSNWVLVPRALLPRLNGVHGRGFDNAPAELKATILAVTKLEHAAAEADRKEGEPAWKSWRRRKKRQAQEAASA